MNTPLSVAAATVVRLKPNARTARPSRPPGTDQFTPPSLLSNAPPPRVPARTSPGLNGLNAIVVAMDLPLWTDAQVEPASLLLSRVPSELPAITTWLFAGSTAMAKIAERPWCGSGLSAAQVEGAGTTAETPIAAKARNHNATNVAVNCGADPPARPSGV